MKTPILKSVLAALLAAISVGAWGVESPQPAIVLWDQVSTSPQVFRAFRFMDLAPDQPGIEMLGVRSTCVWSLAGEMPIEGYLFYSKLQMVTSKWRQIRSYYSVDGAQVATFDIPEIDSGPYPDPRHMFGDISAFNLPTLDRDNSAPFQFVEPPTVIPLQIAYYAEDGTLIGKPLWMPPVPNNCNRLPLTRRASTGIAEAGGVRYFIMSFALVGSYQLPPPVPGVGMPGPPGPTAPRPVTDVSTYWVGVYNLTGGSPIWSITLPGVDAKGWRIALGLSAVADFLPEAAKKTKDGREQADDEVLIAKQRFPAGTTDMVLGYEYRSLATGNLIRSVQVVMPMPALPAVAPAPLAAPMAGPDGYTVAPGTTLSVPAPGVLANDMYPDVTLLAAELVSQPPNGRVTLNPDGSFSYATAMGFSGTDTFVYRATTGSSYGNARVTITVSAPPPL